MGCSDSERKYDYAGADRVRVPGTFAGNPILTPGVIAYTAGDMFGQTILFADIGRCGCAGAVSGSGTIESAILTEQTGIDTLQGPDLSLWLFDEQPADVQPDNSPYIGFTIGTSGFIAKVDLAAPWIAIATKYNVLRYIPNVRIPYVTTTGTLYAFLTTNGVPAYTEPAGITIDLILTKD